MKYLLLILVLLAAGVTEYKHFEHEIQISKLQGVCVSNYIKQGVERRDIKTTVTGGCELINRNNV